MKASLIIPYYNSYSYSTECLFSIKENTKTEYELILIDNGSSEQDIAFDSYVKNIGATVIRNEENEGYPFAINQGLKVAKGEFICVLNNDVVVTPNWLDRLITHIENGETDIVGPCTNSISGPQQIYYECYRNKEELMAISDKLYEEKKEKLNLFYRIVGFCLVFKKELSDKIGGFNEVFFPGNFEDDDFCLRAIDNNYRCGYALDVFIHHFGGVTHKEMKVDYEKILKQNKMLFDNMWSVEKIKELAEKNYRKIGETNGEK